MILQKPLICPISQQHWLNMFANSQLATTSTLLGVTKHLQLALFLLVLLMYGQQFAFKEKHMIIHILHCLRRQ